MILDKEVTIELGKCSLLGKLNELNAQCAQLRARIDNAIAGMTANNSNSDSKLYLTYVALEQELSEVSKIRDQIFWSFVGEPTLVAQTITVEWVDEKNGITTDAEGNIRQFFCSKWDDFSPDFKLVTTQGGTINSSWQTTKNNSFLLAIKKSLNAFFIQNCKNLGYFLWLRDSDNSSRTYLVHKNDVKIGSITINDSNFWKHSFTPNHPKAPRFSKVQDCLQALETAYAKKVADDKKWEEDSARLATFILRRYH